VNNAVCLKDGPIDWYTSKIDGKVDGQGSLYQHSDEYKEKFPHIIQNDKCVRVNGLSFENLCDANNISNIDFMHMDIEGAEYDALLSMGRHRPKLIFMEMLPNYFEKVKGGKVIEKLLESFGYTLVARLSQDRLYIHKP
jgi:FkbM family methyltransferase